jgi:hypothetical protein
MKRSDGIRSLFSADTAPWLSGCEVKPTYSWYLVVGSPSNHHWTKWPRLLLRAARPNIARLQNALLSEDTIRNASCQLFHSYLAMGQNPMMKTKVVGKCVFIPGEI